MPCVVTPNLFAPNFSCPYSAGVCRDIIFLVATNNSFLAWQLYCDMISLSLYQFSITTRNSLVATYFSSLVLVACWAVCRDIELYVATQLPWLFSSLLQFMSRPTFFCCDRILSFLSFYCHDRKLLCRDKSFVFNS